MGMIGEVISLEKGTSGNAKAYQVRVDVGGGELLTAEVYTPAGVHAPPLPGDTVALMKTPGTGRMVALAFLENERGLDADPGEVEIAARDGNGARACFIRMNASGSIEIGNDNGIMEIRADGVFSKDGCTINTSGLVRAPDFEESGANTNFKTHTHNGGAVGPPDAGS